MRRRRDVGAGRHGAVDRPCRRDRAGVGRAEKGRLDRLRGGPRSGRLQNHHGRGSHWLPRVDRGSGRLDGSLQLRRAGAQSAVHPGHPVVRGEDAGGAAGGSVRDRLLPVGAGGLEPLCRAEKLARGRGATLGIPRGKPQVHRGTLRRTARPRGRGQPRPQSVRRQRRLAGGRPAASGGVVPSRWQFIDHRHSQRRGDRQQHGSEPAVRSASQQPCGGPRLNGRAAHDAARRPVDRRGRKSVVQRGRAEGSERRAQRHSRHPVRGRCRG